MSYEYQTELLYTLTDEQKNAVISSIVTAASGCVVRCDNQEFGLSMSAQHTDTKSEHYTVIFFDDRMYIAFHVGSQSIRDILMKIIESKLSEMAVHADFYEM